LDLGIRGGRAPLFPLLGVALGAAGAGIYSLPALPSAVAAALVAILWGALAFAPLERRPGITGWMMFAAAVVLRALLIKEIPSLHVLVIFIAAQTVSRAAMIAIAWVSRPAGYGIADEFLSTMTTPAALIAISIGTVAALLCGLRPAAMMVVGAYLIIRAARWFSYRYAGGVNANSLGATHLLTELFVLVMFTCAACRW
jgi:cobalamin synthase